jgi:hypothetical protein
MRILWIELRNSPLRWFLPGLIIIDLAAVFGRELYWIGVWPQASAAAQIPALYLGPALSATTAWVAGRSKRANFDEHLAAASRQAWQIDGLQFAVILLYGLLAFSAGALAAAAVSIKFAGPGFLWPSYLLLGIAVLIVCAAIGHAMGRLINVRFIVPVVCGIVTFWAIKNSGSPLELFVLYGDPQVIISVVPLAHRLLFAIFAALLAVILPTMLIRTRAGWRTRANLLALGGGSLTVIGAAGLAVLNAGPLIVERSVPKVPLCSNSTPKVCVWPDDRKYLDELTIMAKRLAEIPGDLISLPPAFYERGLRGTSRDAVYYQDFYIIEGFLWSAAEGMAGQVLDTTIKNWCDAADQYKGDRRMAAMWELMIWLKSRATGGERPASIRGGPPVDYSSIGQLIRQPEDIQLQWVRTRLKIIRETPCV